MAARKKATTPTQAATGAVTNQQVRIVARVARMLAMRAQRPNHNGKADHARTIARYQGDWAALSPEQQKAILAAALHLPDMTKDSLAAAKAALES